MNDADDSYTLVPTELDKTRLEELDALEEGRVISENGVWVVVKYPTSPLKKQSWQWCAYSLIVNCPGLPAKGTPYEFKNIKALLLFLEQLEGERKQ